MGISRKRDFYLISSKEDLLNILFRNIHDFAKSHSLSPPQNRSDMTVISGEKSPLLLPSITIHTSCNEITAGSEILVTSLVIPQGAYYRDNKHIYMTAMAILRSA